MSGAPRPGWLRRLQAADPTPDGELIRRFHTRADQDAFELLVHRHAPAVLRVCRAVVRDPHLAEDAAQAVFLVLARKAGAMAGVRSVSSWLARVAYRAARRARARLSSRPGAPLAGATEVVGRDPDPAAAAADADRAAAVLEEVHRLPDRYHAPIVLCYFDGLTHAEAAKMLGWPPGTVSGRLARARAILRDRLSSRGVAVSAGGTAALLSAPASGAVPARFAADVLAGVAGTKESAALVSELAHEVLNAMTPSLVTTTVRAAAALGLAVVTAVVLLGADNRPPEQPPAKQPEKKMANPRLAFDEELAREKKFVAVGRVVSVDGKTPLEGVDVWASTGVGSLFTTGETKTDKDGRFRLVFTSKLQPLGGVAVVGVRKPGWHGWFYGTRPQYILSDKPLPKADVPEQYINIVPGVPTPLEFRMQPAAALRLKLIDGAGKPLAGTRLWLTGEGLPPGASVIEDKRTDADGMLTVEDVPRSSYRLVIVENEDGGRGKLELGSIQFRDAAEYDAVATVHEWGPQATHVSLKVTRGRDR